MMKKWWTLYVLCLLLAVIAIVAIAKNSEITITEMTVSLLIGLVLGLMLGVIGDLSGGLIGGPGIGVFIALMSIAEIWDVNIFFGVLLALGSYAVFWPMYLSHLQRTRHISR